MKELNELVALAKAARKNPSRETITEFELFCQPNNILTIANAFRALEQRAEAAEAKLETKEQELAQYVECFEAEAARADRNHAKLADLERQEPYGYVHNLCNPPGSGVAASIFKEESRHYGRPVFTRPATAINLSGLVPSEFPAIRLQKAKLWIDRVLMDKPGMKEAQTISAILRNIEEAQKK